MRAFTLVIVVCGLFTSTAFAENSVLPVPQPIPQVQEKSSRAKVLNLILHNIQTENWSAVRILSQKALQKHVISLKDLVNLAKPMTENPFTHALQATSNILALRDKTALTPSIVFPIAIFAETGLKEEINKGNFYFKRSIFGRPLQWDPEMKRLIIHLEKIGVPPIGEGRSKVVTKSVLYNRWYPCVLAHGVTTHDVETEVYAMRKLRGLPGLIQAAALLTHKDNHSEKTVTGIVTPIYNCGSLESFLKKYRTSLTLKERIHIAHDLITGLASMHEQGFVHRDLGTRNHFVHMVKSKGNGRKIIAVVADMGRALPSSDADGHYVQGNCQYLCPEGFFQKKMKGNDYYASDVFALGCVFWQLLFDKFPTWSLPRYFKQESMPIKKRYRAHLSSLKQTRKPYLSILKGRKGHGPHHDSKTKFLALILKMTSPNPKARGTAQELKTKFDDLVKEI